MSLSELVQRASRQQEPRSMQQLLTRIVRQQESDAANYWLRHLADSPIEMLDDAALTAIECNQLLRFPAWEWDSTMLARALFIPASITNLMVAARGGNVHPSYGD